MVRVISKRPIKKTIKRASTVSERLRRKSPGELIQLLAIYPNSKFSPIIRKYLSLIYNLSDEEVDARVYKIKEKRKIKQELGAYYKGLIPEGVIEEKYKEKEFVKSPGVRNTAKHYNKFTIPTGMMSGGYTTEVEHAGKTTIGGKTVSRPRTVQRLLSESPMWSEYRTRRRKIRDYLEDGKEDLAIKEADKTTEWMLKLAQNRPEFAANIAYILYTDHPMKESKKSFGRNPQLKNKMEDILTERQMEFYKKHPFKPSHPTEKQMLMKHPDYKHRQTYEIDEEGTFEKPPQEEDVKKSMTKFKGEVNILPVPGSRFYSDKDKKMIEVHNTAGIPYKELGFADKPKFRKKKTKKPIRRKVRKVIKRKKQIKKCRCK